MPNQKILTGKISFKTAHMIDKIPTNHKGHFLRKYCWIESTPLKGDRTVWVDEKLRTGERSAPIYGLYGPAKFLYIDKNRKLRLYSVSFHDTADTKDELVRLFSFIKLRQISDVQLDNIRQFYLEAFIRKHLVLLLSGAYLGARFTAISQWMALCSRHILTSSIQTISDLPDHPEFTP